MWEGPRESRDQGHQRGRGVRGSGWGSGVAACACIRHEVMDSSARGILTCGVTTSPRVPDKLDRSREQRAELAFPGRGMSVNPSYL